MSLITLPNKGRITTVPFESNIILIQLTWSKYSHYLIVANDVLCGPEVATGSLHSLVQD